ncbi:MAG: class I SAM-dependent methyltransferase, partial [Solirubrobacterales bacterium]
MSQDERASPTRDSEEFATEVRGMFDRISGVYDLMNTAMTAGMHHEWRRRAVDEARVGPGSDVLDLCCGTGDLTLALRERIGPDGRVAGVDFSEQMLDLARRKSGERGLGVEFGWADVLAL